MDEMTMKRDKIVILSFCFGLLWAALVSAAPNDRNEDGICEKCNRNIVIGLSPYESKDGKVDPAKYGVHKGMPYEDVVRKLGKPKREDIQDYFRYAFYPDGLMIYFISDPVTEVYVLSYCEDTAPVIICPYCGRVQGWKKALKEYATTRQDANRDVPIEQSGQE